MKNNCNKKRFGSRLIKRCKLKDNHRINKKRYLEFNLMKNWLLKGQGRMRKLG